MWAAIWICTNWLLLISLNTGNEWEVTTSNCSHQVNFPATLNSPVCHHLMHIQITADLSSVRHQSNASSFGFSPHQRAARWPVQISRGSSGSGGPLGEPISGSVQRGVWRVCPLLLHRRRVWELLKCLKRHEWWMAVMSFHSMGDISGESGGWSSYVTLILNYTLNIIII